MYASGFKVSLMASVLCGDGPMSFVAEAPLTVISPTGYNNTATIAFAVATTTGPAATHIVAMLVASEIANAVQLHKPAMLAVFKATLEAMAVASEIENAPFNTALPLNVATSSASFPPNTYCQNEEDFVVSFLSSGAVGKNEDSTPAVGGEKTGVASLVGGLDEDAPQDAPAEQDMELHYYRSHKASFNIQAFPPGMVTASKSKIQIDCIRNVVHTWYDYSDRAKNQTLSEREEKAFTHFKGANKPGNKWIKQYKTFEFNANGNTKVILHRMELQKMLFGKRDHQYAINYIHRSTGHMGMERTHTHCADKYFSITQEMVCKYCRICHVCVEGNPVIAFHHEAKKSIYSDNWRDCFQVGLVDFRKFPRPNIYGQVQHWLMAVKDHSTDSLPSFCCQGRNQCLLCLSWRGTLVLLDTL